ncbi:hypothetical protein XH88_26295, partial [Bradyrhizobium sp. CCBAU 51627]|nr:hypothetical protein [Bradyrhizobium sp. CCBAU 51627]
QSRPPATALCGSARPGGLALPNYTTTGDTTLPDPVVAGDVRPTWATQTFGQTSELWIAIDRRKLKRQPQVRPGFVLVGIAGLERFSGQ